MYCVGVDIGGMSVKAGVVDDGGKIVRKDSVATDVKAGADKMIADIAALVERVSSGFDTVGIGVGSPGAIDSAAGIVNRACNLEWTDVEVVKKLRAYIDKPVKISNDANVAALGEAMYGAGKAYSDLILLTLGTGVGGGIILGGKLYEGNESKGAELGHVVIAMDGEQCTCGRRGCLEAYASATALMRQTREAMKRDRTSSMWKYSPTLEEVSGKTAFECSKNGDRAANEVVDNYVKYLGEGMLNFANIFRPQAIILGGGVCAQGDYLINKLDAYCKARSYGFGGTPKFDIVTAALGNDAGIIGAAGLIFSSI